MLAVTPPFSSTSNSILLMWMWLSPSLRRFFCRDVHLAYRIRHCTGTSVLYPWRSFPSHGRSMVFTRFYARLRSKVQSSEMKKGKKIKSKTVRLIDENGSNLGVMDTVVAVQIAQGKALEIVQVTNDDQPVCKLMSKKQIWEESKNLKEKNKKDPKAVVKEVQIMVGISENDLNNKIKTIVAFLEREHPVKLWIQVKRRHRSTKSLDDRESLFKLVMSNIKEFGTEKDVTYSPRGLTCTLRSNKDKK